MKNTICFRQEVAIIIPFKDREAHLRALLYYLHPMLNRQRAHYCVYVAEQVLSQHSYHQFLTFVKSSPGGLVQFIHLHLWTTSCPPRLLKCPVKLATLVWMNLWSCNYTIPKMNLQTFGLHQHKAGPALRGDQGGLAPIIDMLGPQLTSLLF